MKRPLVVWLVFAACALIGLAVLGWFSIEMLRLDRGAEQAREIAGREENVRLALWRMDSALASVHGLEAARPVEDYAPFLRRVNSFTPDLAPLAPDGVMLPSPLLGYTPPFVRLHLEVDDAGRISSPQVPEGAAYLAAVRAGTSLDDIGAASERLRMLRAVLPNGALAAELNVAPSIARKDERRSTSSTSAAGESVLDERSENQLEVAPAPQIAPQAERQVVQELKKNIAEQQQRAELVGDNYYAMNSLPQQRARGLERKPASPADQGLSDAAERSGEATETADAAVPRSFVGTSTGLVSETDGAFEGLDRPLALSESDRFDMAAPAGGAVASSAAQAQSPVPAKGVPVPDSSGVRDGAPAVVTHEPEAGPIEARWIGEELFFLRRVDGADRGLTQAVWLDWPELRAWLLSRVTDLLPDAALEPVADNSNFTLDDSSRRLAFLPVRLRPGAVALPVSSMRSPLQISLGIAWALASVGVVALGLLLAGTLRLSERRGAFVSAVTHELRTPLTTFRMYTEMLSSGMVPDEARRRSYLDTLRKEAERLSHLVENVLSYARLERGRASQRIEDTTPGTLLARIEERLKQRAEQGGLALTIAFEPGAEELPLRIDTTAFEQIVFNLVDNAAKYARRPDGGGALAIQAAPGQRGRLLVRVSDNGPGIAASVRKRLFQPFSKSAAEAAHSQPGVGLGLALSRRLARDELHGELALETTGPLGTVFRLEV